MLCLECLYISMNLNWWDFFYIIFNWGVYRITFECMFSVFCIIIVFVWFCMYLFWCFSCCKGSLYDLGDYSIGGIDGGFDSGFVMR